MPRAVYIICSESGSIDRKKNSASIFNIVERILLVPLPQPSPQGEQIEPRLAVSLRVIATWMLSEGDTIDQLFHTEWVAHFPGPEKVEMVIGSTDFSFEARFHRLIIEQLNIPGFFGPGVFRLECRIRRGDETEWLARQDFPIILEEAPVNRVKDAELAEANSATD